MIPYRAEFFDRQLNYQLFTVIDEPEIKMDYLTLDKTSITLPFIVNVSRGWYCQIMRGAETLLQGTVASVSQSKGSTSVQIAPMVALFETPVYKNRTTYSKTGLEGWIAEILTENFRNSGDSVQDIYDFSATSATSTSGIALNLEDNVHDFWTDIAKKAIENAKVVIECSFDPQSKTVNAVVKSYADTPEITLEADLPNVINQNFTLRDDTGSTNKCIIVNQNNESEQAVFYSEDYAAPTVRRIEFVTVETGKTFTETAKDKAEEILKKSDFDNLIELQYRIEDPIVPEIKIGQPCRIIKNGTVYHSVLTGHHEKSGMKTLIFGGVRVDFTKILKLKGAI